MKTLKETIKDIKFLAEEATDFAKEQEYEQLAKWLEELRAYKTSKELIVRLGLEGAQELQNIIQDAKRYRRLRTMHWYDSELCVVLKPKESLKLGSFAPCGDLLDAEIDRRLDE